MVSDICNWHDVLTFLLNVHPTFTFNFHPPGFQARILDGNLASIEETFAISPAVALPSVSSPTTGEPKTPVRHASFPCVDLEGYSSALQAKALGAVRRGAVYIAPCTSNPTAITTTSYNNSPLPAAQSGSEEFPFHVENNIFYLAFRWIGSEHTNAEGASQLSNLSQANLNPVQGIGLMKIDNPNRKSANPLETTDKCVGGGGGGAAATSAAIPAAVKADKEWKGSIFSSPSNFFKKKGSSKSQLRIERVLQTPIENPGVEDHPFMVEFYFDNRLIPLTNGSMDGGEDKGKGKATNERQQTSMRLQGGALLDLGVLGSAMPDAPAKEILHTITMHLWDATRGDVNDALAGSFLFSKPQDLKKRVAPNVIL